VHGFYYYVIQKAGPGRYLLSPKWDQGLMAGDEIETCEHGTLRSLGRTRITQLAKRKAPGLKGKIAPLWKNKSPSTQPDLVYDVVLQHDLPLRPETASRRSPGPAPAGDPALQLPRLRPRARQVSELRRRGLPVHLRQWNSAPGGQRHRLLVRIRVRRQPHDQNNHFTDSVTGANEMTWAADTLGAITVAVSLPEGVNGFPNSFQNRNVTIEGNRIDDSYIYAIFVSNADSVRIAGNVIGQTFIRGSAFDAGGRFGVHPDSAILIGRSRNVQISDNTVARGRVTQVAVTIDGTCDKNSVRVAKTG